MTEIWISEEGLAREGSVQDGEGYALRAFGLAKVLREDERLGITWDVEGIAPDALLAVRKLICEVPSISRFDLRFNYGGWVDETYRDRWQALDRLDQVMAYAEYRPPEDIRIDKAPRDCHATDRIVALRSIWLRREGFLGDGEVADLNSLSDYLLVFDDLRYQHIGGESLFWRVCGPSAASDCMGRSYDYDPAQKSYSKAVCKEYGEILARRRPSYSHVCAPIEIKRERNWLIYQRYIAPFQLPGGRPILVVLCDRTQDVSIPFLRGELH